jgi:DNA helicase-2/ATP-dependent DNA helicase PcrA
LPTGSFREKKRSYILPYNGFGGIRVTQEKIKVFGPPGTGKTRTLMGDRYGYQYLLSQGYTSEDITVVTYRKDSAKDLIQKVQHILKIEEKYLKPHVGTLHSICLRLIENPPVISEKDIRKFANEFGYTSYSKVCAKKPKVRDVEDESDLLDDDEFSGDLFDVYAWCKSTCTPLENWIEYPGYDFVDMQYDDVLKFFNDYEKFKLQCVKVDFSDMLQQVIDRNILLDTPVLIVDEFQDLTKQMYKIFESWARWCDHVIIAGDPNQSIYGYAGGSPDFFINYHADEVKLKRSYRLPDPINLLSRKVLEVEGIIPPDTFGKTGYNDVIKFLDYDDEFPIHNNELHLFRCRYQIPAMALRFAERGVVFTTPTPYPGWSKSEIDIANAIISYRTGQKLNKEQLIAVIDRFSTKITGITEYGKTEVERKRNFVTNNLVNIIEPSMQLIMSVANQIVLNNFKLDNPTKNMIGGDSKLFVTKIIGVMDRKNIIPYQEAKNRRLMTIHTSKGLEADAVFLHNGVSPAVESSIYGNTEQSQAEARVWYVGTSRAREILYVVDDKGRKYELPDIYDIPIRNVIPSVSTEEFIKAQKLVMANW